MCGERHAPPTVCFLIIYYNMWILTICLIPQINCLFAGLLFRRRWPTCDASLVGKEVSLAMLLCAVNRLCDLPHTAFKRQLWPAQREVR